MYRIFVTILIASHVSRIAEAIVGGKDAQVGQFPYAVSIVDSTNLKPVCGGVVLDNWTILTHVSCITKNFEIYKIFIGELQMANKTDDNLYTIANHIANPDNNLLALKLKRELNTDVITPVQLPSTDAPIDQDMELMSWGIIDTTTQQSANTLQYITLRTINNTKCEYTWGHIDDTQICTTHFEYDCGPCLNDIGAPLVYNDTLFGILSNSSSQCIGEDPNIYVNVNSYLDWIQSILNE